MYIWTASNTDTAISNEGIGDSALSVALSSLSAALCGHPCCSRRIIITVHKVFELSSWI
jgi:hypothetical protein